MKPSQLSLFPTAQADTWRYSDEDACFNCNRRVYDMEKNAEVCSVDGRIMDEEQAAFLNEIKHVGNIHIAWDLPQMDLRPQLEKMCKYVHPSKITCYILVGFNSTKEQDLHRARVLKELGISPFAQAYRDFENKRKPSQYELDFCRWCNKRQIFNTCDFPDFRPRKYFKCSRYFNN